jgi:hypothetical protein
MFWQVASPLAALALIYWFVRNNNQTGGSGSLWITPNGTARQPTGVPLPQTVPFQK